MKRNHVFIALTLLLLTVTFSSCNWVKDTWKSITGNDTTEVCSDTAHAIEYTAYDVVAQRRAEIESMKFDSAYYALPEPILIAILDDIGVTVGRNDVVTTYLKNKAWYDGVLAGVNNKKHFQPDTIPNKAPIDVTQKVIPKDSIK